MLSIFTLVPLKFILILAVIIPSIVTGTALFHAAYDFESVAKARLMALEQDDDR